MLEGDMTVLAPISFAYEVPSDGPLTEVVDGEEVAKPIMSVYANVIASILARKMGNAAEAGDLGQVVAEVLFRFQPRNTRMRRPDVAFVSYQRWAKDQDLTSGNGWEVVPDLAVEVVSPTDLAAEVMRKVYEYLEAGVVEVWLVYPELRRVHRFDSTGGITSVGPAGVLDGGSLLPGFELPLADLFRNKA